MDSRRRFKLLALVGVVGLCAAILLNFSSSTYANTFTVNTTNDTVDVAPGDGTCLDANGACSLRAAVMEANALGGGPHLITLAAQTYLLTIPYVAGPFGDTDAALSDLDVSVDIHIEGVTEATTIIDGGGIMRIFQLTNRVEAKPHPQLPSDFGRGGLQSSGN